MSKLPSLSFKGSNTNPSANAGQGTAGMHVNYLITILAILY